MRVIVPTRRIFVKGAAAATVFGSSASAASSSSARDRRLVWSLPMDQASLDAIRPTTTTTSKLPRSTFGGYDDVATETGVDVYNNQLLGVRPFVVGPDKRVHLRCLALPTPLRDHKGVSKSIGQARLIAPVNFMPGDLVEWDVQHVQPGWLITWTTGEFGWPLGGEIDMEYRPDWCARPQTLNLVEHFRGSSPSGLGGVSAVGADLTRPHLRSLEWTPDGQTIIARVNGAIVAHWPMLWNGRPQIVVTQATAYLPFSDGMIMPELSLGFWRHFKNRA